MLRVRVRRKATLVGALLLGLLLGGVTPATAHAEQVPTPVAESGGLATDGVISGTVRDPRGLAASNEKFTVIAFMGRNLKRVIGVSNQADDAGRYRIEGLPRTNNVTLLLMTSGVYASAVAEVGWVNSYDVATFEYVNLEHGDAAGIDFTAQPGFSDMCMISEFCNRFYKEIMWMRTAGLSTGVRVESGGHSRSTQHYMPHKTVTREAMAAFLYRLASQGASAPAGYTIPAQSPFADVPTTHKFYKEIAWMHASGLSTGIKRGNQVVYAPKSGVSREAMAAFMYRREKPNYTVNNTPRFSDVFPGHKFFTQIQWMYDSGLSTGVKQSSGKPAYLDQARVTREAMAAFLYRSEN